MGFMDKVKSQATQLAEKAQEGLQTGKGKLDELQEKKRAQGLLQQLGADCYKQRTDRADAGTDADVDRLVIELRKIEESGVDFLPDAGNTSTP